MENRRELEVLRNCLAGTNLGGIGCILIEICTPYGAKRFGIHFWRHLGDFGRHFGVGGAEGGFQNGAFGQLDANKNEVQRRVH